MLIQLESDGKSIKIFGGLFLENNVFILELHEALLNAVDRVLHLKIGIPN